MFVTMLLSSCIPVFAQQTDNCAEDKKQLAAAKASKRLARAWPLPRRQFELGGAGQLARRVSCLWATR